MGVVNLRAERGDPPSSEDLNDRGSVGVGAAAERMIVVQLQAQTRHEQPAPQAETAAEVAAW
jgi:hypothetical protein